MSIGLDDDEVMVISGFGVNLVVFAWDDADAALGEVGIHCFLRWGFKGVRISLCC